MPALMTDPTHRPAPVAEAPAAPADAPLSLADRLVVICFFVGVALFGLISLADLLYGLAR